MEAKGYIVKVTNNTAFEDTDGVFEITDEVLVPTMNDALSLLHLLSTIKHIDEVNIMELINPESQLAE